MAVLVGMGVVFYHLHLDVQSLVGLVVYTLLGTATMCAIGLALTRVATTADSASAIGPFSTVSLAFVSGVFIPVSQLPAWLRDVGRLFPLAHLANGLQSAFIEHALDRPQRRGRRRAGGLGRRRRGLRRADLPLGAPGPLSPQVGPI